MKIYAIGDFHLSLDHRVNKPMDDFGEIWINHVDLISKNWTNTVQDDDIVILVGDLSWGINIDEALPDLHFIDNLPGSKVLVKGNHDYWWQSISKIRDLPINMTFIQNDSFVIKTKNDTKLAICGTRGWLMPGSLSYEEHDEKLYIRELGRLESSLRSCQMHNPDIIIAALHFPPTNTSLQASLVTDILSKYGVKKCVYGHLHKDSAFKNGLQGVLNGVEYHLVSYDYLKGLPKLIYEF